MTKPIVFMRRSEVISLKEAVRRYGGSDKTIRKYCLEYGISSQPVPNAPLRISAPGLHMVMHGQWEALELLRSGDRTTPVVRRIFDDLGIPATLDL